MTSALAAPLEKARQHAQDVQVSHSEAVGFIRLPSLVQSGTAAQHRLKVLHPAGCIAYTASKLETVLAAADEANAGLNRSLAVGGPQQDGCHVPQVTASCGRSAAMACTGGAILLQPLSCLSDYAL